MAPPPVRVWVVSHAYTASVSHDKLRALAAHRDLDITVLLPRRWRTSLGDLTPPAASGPYRVVRSRLLASGRAGAHVYLDGWVALARARPDIVHAEVEPWSLAALQCVLAARGAPVVVFTWENLGGPRRAFARAVERAVLRRAAFVIAGNEAARRRMERLGVSSDRLAVLPQFGVDPARYAAADPASVRAPWPRARPVVGYVGRLVPEKGVGVLIEAVAPLDARLLVVGDGPARASLEARVAGGAPGRAVFAGAVSHAGVPPYLRAMDVLVLPSLTTATWAEQFGHVLIEAMAAGLPVVGSSSGAIPEVVGEAGLIVPEGDAVALRAALARVLADPGLRADLAARGRARVEARFTQTAIVAAQREIYARLLRR